MDYKILLTGIFDKLSGLKEERPTAGTKYRLMGLVADIAEVAQTLQQEVLQRVSQEAVLDADVDIDYEEMSEQVKATGLEQREGLDEAVSEQIRLANEGLLMLGDLLAQIDGQLKRRHKDEEYARLYDQEKRRYLNSGTSGRARRTFEEWLYDVCYGSPSVDDFNDYVTEKLVHMFEKGVFDTKVEHVQRAKRYPGEFDFEQLDDERKIKKTIYKHYAVLRKLVDFRDGYLVVNATRVGQHFFASRKDENARALRNAFLKYMHKIDLAQQERRKQLETETGINDTSETTLNYFAPAKNLKTLLQEEWFEIHRIDKRYDQNWTDGFVNALMKSEHRDYIASEWSRDKRQDYIRGCMLGLLKEGGVIKGSMDSIARSTGVCENYRTFSKYMGQCRQEPYADWVLDYIKKPAE